MQVRRWCMKLTSPSVLMVRGNLPTAMTRQQQRSIQIFDTSSSRDDNNNEDKEEWTGEFKAPVRKQKKMNIFEQRQEELKRPSHRRSVTETRRTGDRHAPRYNNQTSSSERESPPVVFAEKRLFKHLPIDKWPKNLLIPVDKPTKMTSNDLVTIIKRLLRAQKCGHAGTIDPNATGLMLIGVNAATKVLDSFLTKDKTYTFITRFGEVTASLDADTPVTQVDDNHIERCKNLSLDEIRQIIRQQFIGEIQQRAPLYSAVIVNGVRLYSYAHKQQEGKQVNLSEIELPLRDIKVYDFTIERAENGDPRDFLCKAHCSKGTYVRCLGNDLARACGFIGGHVTELRRTHVGGHNVEDAWTMDELAQLANRPIMNEQRKLLKVKQD